MRQFVLVVAGVLGATTARGAELLTPGAAFPAWMLADNTAMPQGQAPQ